MNTKFLVLSFLAVFLSTVSMGKTRIVDPENLSVEWEAEIIPGAGQSQKVVLSALLLENGREIASRSIYEGEAHSVYFAMRESFLRRLETVKASKSLAEVDLGDFTRGARADFRAALFLQAAP
jgi:hypothetical protein